MTVKQECWKWNKKQIVLVPVIFYSMCFGAMKIGLAKKEELELGSYLVKNSKERGHMDVPLHEAGT